MKQQEFRRFVPKNDEIVRAKFLFDDGAKVSPSNVISRCSRALQGSQTS